MKKALIINSYIEYFSEIKPLSEFDLIIAADGGYLQSIKLKLIPDIIIGDFDSSAIPIDAKSQIVILPKEKDMTDCEAAIDLAVANNCDCITVLGGLGGRFDHTLGNIALLSKYCTNKISLSFMDGKNYVTMLNSGKSKLYKSINGTEYQYFGLLSFSHITEELTIKGCKYELDSHNLTNSTTLCISNEVISEDAYLSFIKGQLIISYSRD